jgi:ARP2/3 complex 20 kDa subunit (ARPC4)
MLCVCARVSSNSLGSVNSVRVSISLKIADDLEEILANKFCRFMMMRYVLGVLSCRVS